MALLLTSLDNNTKHQQMQDVAVAAGNELLIEIDVSDHTVDGTKLRVNLSMDDRGNTLSLGTLSIEANPKDKDGNALSVVSQRIYDRTEGIYSLDGGKTWDTFVNVPPKRVQQILATPGVMQSERSVPFDGVIVKSTISLEGDMPKEKASIATAIRVEGR